jgi:ERCC4-type nuclease
MKYLLIDTREKPKAIQSILKTFDDAGIAHESTKLLFGDYMDWNRPNIVIDRKQNIAELAKNCTREHERFKSEMERARKAGATLVILVEQNRYKDRDKWRKVEQVEDLINWSSPHTMIIGEKVYRVLKSWMAKYPIRVEFCDKRSTGKRIIEIIYGEKR